MIWLLASALFLAGAVYALWPLLRHWQPGRVPVPEEPAGAAEGFDTGVGIGAGHASGSRPLDQRSDRK
ncbi:MAG: hypothetical protein M3072_05495 [Candidatus Dormibacteraeota bacterium]|nr:hypothetical protein [Candidatus Dormibacteraeota bacterium]